MKKRSYALVGLLIFSLASCGETSVISATSSSSSVSSISSSSEEAFSSEVASSGETSLEVSSQSESDSEESSAEIDKWTVGTNLTYQEARYNLNDIGSKGFFLEANSLVKEGKKETTYSHNDQGTLLEDVVDVNFTYKYSKGSFASFETNGINQKKTSKVGGVVTESDYVETSYIYSPEEELYYNFYEDSSEKYYSKFFPEDELDFLYAIQGGDPYKFYANRTIPSTISNYMSQAFNNDLIKTLNFSSSKEGDLTYEFVTNQDETGVAMSIVGEIKNYSFIFNRTVFSNDEFPEGFCIDDEYNKDEGEASVPIDVTGYTDGPVWNKGDTLSEEQILHNINACFLKNRIRPFESMRIEEAAANDFDGTIMTVRDVLEFDCGDSNDDFFFSTYLSLSSHQETTEGDQEMVIEYPHDYRVLYDEASDEYTYYFLNCDTGDKECFKCSGKDDEGMANIYEIESWAKSYLDDYRTLDSILEEITTAMERDDVTMTGSADEDGKLKIEFVYPCETHTVTISDYYLMAYTSVLPLSGGSITLDFKWTYNSVVPNTDSEGWTPVDVVNAFKK